VLEVPVIEIKKKEGKIIYKNGDKKIETEVTNGKCKLQWKIDWAMRWYVFDVDYEMYGKDLIESAILSSKICQTLGKKSPNGFAYEMFLDEKGEKISKSKGNGITIEQWLKYASPESLTLYMYQNPKRAKKLYADVVPKAVDEYLACIDKFSEQNIQHRLLNPVWHVHNGNPPKEKSIMPFSVLLNLVGTSNATDKDVLWKFIKKYKKDIKVSDHPILDSLAEYALKYFEDIVNQTKNIENLMIKKKKHYKIWLRD